jgi:hypothetical protein
MQGHPLVGVREVVAVVHPHAGIGRAERHLPHLAGPHVEGVWRQIVYDLQAAGDAQGLIGWEVGVDSTICRAHQHAAGASTKANRQAEPPGGVEAEPDDHALGRSRGGLSTKLYLACEQGQKLLSLVVTAGQRGDAPQFEAVMAAIRVFRSGPGRPRTRPARVRADKAYSSQAIRSHLRRRGIRATIPEPADRVQGRLRRGSRGGRPPAFDRIDYRDRNAVEHGINRAYPERTATRVHVVLRDGRELHQERSDFEGSPTWPMTWERVVDKLHRLGEPFADAPLRAKIVTAVEKLEDIPVAELTALLAQVSPVAERPRTRHRL